MSISISERNCRIFKLALHTMNGAGIPYVIGGAFAIYHYTGIWRDTNDLDMYIDRGDLPGSADALAQAGFMDYGEMAAGDREWIYHSTREDVMVDLIWQTPNHLAPVDTNIHERGPTGEFLGVPVRFLPADVLVWAKIFTMNRHRCDWPDIFNVARACPRELDWYHLMFKLADNWPVLLAFVTMFDWAYPEEASCIPNQVRDELIRRKQHQPPSRHEPTRESLLDPWIYTRPIAP